MAAAAAAAAHSASVVWQTMLCTVYSMNTQVINSTSCLLDSWSGKSPFSWVLKVGMEMHGAMIMRGKEMVGVNNEYCGPGFDCNRRSKDV